ncbi:aminotransferase class I/II-fold pyridoxal phosphate-dependent enzyme [Chryseobacterium nematophagum]|uniref:Aminotransferase class I/II-fold pyridoxal phosphate-dependent enzyme n=1 Tax=Chryseobacterium nematophagum TaxID=2305228 RepID=A0A3M7TEE6_9FLAO|nr:aminotransferase class I/II-fold pyridoxal phosphate-dependent enzyme [Chryseobacterium nematophagum]RNA61444.1 aminotransferase class I/II-fold pyridoxal phosphate-dependent enzyme [Chryseobacterium nematophagum]
MKLKNFAVERYFANYEFSAKYMISSSDCDGFEMSEVLSLADLKEKNLWEKLTLGYTETSGSLFLKEAIQKHYKTIELNEILVASPGELNFVLMNILLDKNDHIISMTPTYQSLYQIAIDIGCSVSYWKPQIEHNKWNYSVEKLKTLIKPNTKMLVINFPHNPTGYQPTLNEYKEIIEIAKK